MSVAQMEVKILHGTQNWPQKIEEEIMMQSKVRCKDQALDKMN